MNAPMQKHVQTKPDTQAAFSTAPTSLLQRKCACGGTAGVDGQCAQCRMTQLQPQRTNFAAPNGVSPIAHDALHSPGQPLDTAARSFPEPRFSHDFHNVRVHSDSESMESVCKRSTNACFGRHNADRRTGIPDKLKAGLEQLSAIDLTAVRVHYNSSEPAQVNALAYTQGQDIWVGPGQETHLPHEGWHVVQQIQGRVKPTIQTKATLINDDDGLEREADVMGAKALILGEQTGAFQTRIGTATGAELDEEPYVVAMAPVVEGTAIQPAKLPMSLKADPIIQRVATFVAGTVSATTNLAAHLISGRRDAGFTPPTLNGTTILSAATAQGAIHAPALGGRSNADGTADAWVNTVPTNEGSFTMQVPSAGPWSTVTTKANVAALFTSLGLTAQAGCGTAGNTTFRVNGRPADADFAANVRTHEDLHAADHRTGFNNVIGGWDTRLEAARAAGTLFNGATAAAAEAALFTAMGGTPDQIATAQHNTWIALNNATHRGMTTATGGPATPSNSAADATCSTSSLDLT